MKPAIEVKNLSKVYKIGHEDRVQAGTVTLRDTLTSLARKPLELFTGHKLKHENFWALKDISFKVEPGDVVGIIGRNGSGKSTLLKVLSRIVEPTTGEVIMRGKVASLLEVGTGFHPELTGRENIFFNGAILGMPKKEIESKFSDIVEFSEIEKFLDTPVKFYSSGMYVRLAFAVAAHLEPDILIVDEVLAVGDAAFQKKCLGKMKDVAGEGRTVLFVSHNMGSVRELCNKGILLTNGNISDSGSIDSVISSYFSALGGDTVGEWKNEGEINNDQFVPTRIFATSQTDKIIKAPHPNSENIKIHIEGNVIKPNPLLNVGISLYAETGELLFWSFTSDSKEQEWPKLNKGKVSLVCEIPAHFLNEGNYVVEVNASHYNTSWILQPMHNSPSITFSIHGSLSESPHWMDKRPGLLAPILKWKLNE